MDGWMDGWMDGCNIGVRIPLSIQQGALLITSFIVILSILMLSFAPPPPTQIAHMLPMTSKETRLHH
jgi:hypothetical protein